jgi:hypothetical protein
MTAEGDAPLFDWITQSDIHRLRKALREERDPSCRASLEAKLQNLEMQLVTANDPALGRPHAQ